jgi:hypothetical protein
MTMTCTVCRHGRRPDIDAAIIEGVPNRRIAAQHGLTENAIRRHKAKHLTEALAAAEGEERDRASDLLQQIEDLQDRALTILNRAEGAGELRTALLAIREARGNLELQRKIWEAGELESRIEALEAREGGW